MNQTKYDPKTYIFKKENHPPTEICEIIGVKPEYSHFLSIKDVYYFEGPEKNDRGPLLKIKQVTDHRDKYKTWETKKRKDEEGKLTWGDMVELESSGGQCFLDAFDGIVFDTAKNIIVCKIDDLPVTKAIHEERLNEYVEENGDTEVRIWTEGTVVIVFTYRGHTFFSTRSKLNFEKTIVNTSVPNCPFLKEIWEDACEIQNFDDSQLIEEGMVHVMLVVSRWNQIINQQEVTPSISHIKSYSFDKETANYKLEKNVKMENCVSIPVITLREGMKHVRNGGVLVTTKPFKNEKIMTYATCQKYNLRSEQNVQLVYCKLEEEGRGEELMECLPPFIREHLKKSIKEYPLKKEDAVSYIFTRYIRSLRHKDLEAASRNTNYFKTIINSVKTRYHNNMKRFY